MSQMTKDQIKAVLKQFILNELISENKATEIGDDQPLLSTGMLDSLFIVDLLLFIEDSFGGIKIDLESVSKSDLDTIEAISEIIYKKIQENP